jgi:hypothetical protein
MSHSRRGEASDAFCVHLGVVKRTDENRSQRVREDGSERYRHTGHRWSERCP